jgi:sulfur relay (sulfurtransferase) complex TusBCD TusD component (DsrE family)
MPEAEERRADRCLPLAGLKDMQAIIKESDRVVTF